MNKTYFKYLLENKRNLLIFLCIINLLIPTLVYFVSISDGYYNDTCTFSILVGCGLLLLECIVLPMIHYSFLQNKRGVDTIFALPLSRKEIYITNYVLVLCEVVIPHVLATLPIVISEFMIQENVVHFGYYFVYVLALIFVCAALILAVCALILKTNTIIDSFIMVGSYIMVPVLIYMALYSFVSTQAYGVNPYGILQNFLSYTFLPVAYMKSFPMYIFNTFENNEILYSAEEIFPHILVFVCIALIALISVIYDMKKRKAEDAEQLSTNIFTYPMIIALVTFTLLLDVIFADLGFGPTGIFFIAIFVLFSVMVCVYKRKITFSKKSLILFGLTLILGYTTVFASSVTNAFGLDYSYKKEDVLQSLYVNFDINTDEESIGFYVSTKDAEDDVIMNQMHGEYTYEDLINYIQKRQTYFVKRYGNKEQEYNEYETYMHHYLSVDYDDNSMFAYNENIKINKEAIQMMIEDIKFYSQFNFLELNINYNKTIEENGETDYVDIALTPEQLIEKLEAYVS